MTVVPRARRGLAVAVSAFVVLCGLAACGGSSSKSTSSTNTAQSGALEKTKIVVRVLPVADVAPLYIGIKNGYFKAEGLTVEPQVINLGTQAIGALKQGSLDVCFANYVSFFSAVAKGLQIRVVSDGYQAKPNMQVVTVLPDSPIKKISDLAGKKIGTSTPGNISQLAAMAILQTNGVDPKSVKFVKIDNAAMASSLKNKAIDAAYELEPFLSQDQQKYGVVKVFDAMQGPTADIAIAGYAVTEKWAKANPNTFAAFQRAMAKAQAAAADRSAVEQILPTYTKIDAKTASVINLGTFPTTVNETRLRRVVDLMVQFGMLKDASQVDLSAMVKSG